MERTAPRAAGESPSLLISGAVFGLKTCKERKRPPGCISGVCASPGARTARRAGAGHDPLREAGAGADSGGESTKAVLCKNP